VEAVKCSIEARQHLRMLFTQG